MNWAPIIEQENNPINNELKYALKKKLYGKPKMEMNVADIEYLTGLLHANLDGAQELIDAIEKYDTISVFIQY